jgi:hypothetical protein
MFGQVYLSGLVVQPPKIAAMSRPISDVSSAAALLSPP